MTYDGESVSLWPSIGNWNLRCRSLYIIDQGRIKWAESWSEAQVAAERRRDKAAKATYYESSPSPEVLVPAPEVTKPVEQPNRWLSRLSKWFFRS
jgi:hypothetical protein